MFVRYRYNTDRTRRYTTVEIIVDEAERKIISGRNPANKLVFIRVLRHERYIQRMIKSVGAHWKPRECLWEIPFREVMALGLEDRIVKGK